MSETEQKPDEKPAEPAPAATEASPEARQAVAETAAEGGSPRQAEQAAAAEEHVQRPERTDKENKALASALVDEFEARGMFEDQGGAETPLPPTAEPSADGSTSAPANGSSSAGGPDEEPRKRSFFERFMGVR